MPAIVRPVRGRVLTRAERTAVGLWVAVAIGISLRVLIAAIHKHNVFLVYRQAAWNWIGGHDLYAPQPDLDVFHYSPLVAAGMVPVGVLPVRLGSVVWRLMNLVVLLAGLGWCCRAVWPHLSPVQRGMVFLLVVPLAIPSLNNGQSNALVLGLILAGLAAVARLRWTLAAGLVAAAVLFKLYPVAVGLLLAAVFPVRFAGRFIAAVLAGLLLPFAFQSPEYVGSQYQSWLASVAADDRTQLPLHLWLRDIRLVFKVWLTPLSPAAFVALQLLTAAGAAALCLAGRLRGLPTTRLLTAVLGLGCCWMTVFGPMVESATWILIAPVLAVALVEAWAGNRPRWHRLILTLAFGLFLLDHTFGWWSGGRAYRGLALQPIAGLLLTMVVIAQVIREIWGTWVDSTPVPKPCPDV